MSKDETTQPAQRIKLSDPKTEPNPPWTNKYFDCECGAQYQLGCADDLEEIFNIGETRRCFRLPPCWTCGRVNFLSLAADTFQEGNPS